MFLGKAIAIFNGVVQGGALIYLKSIFLTISLTMVTVSAQAAEFASDLWKVMAPANKLCIAKNIPTLTSGLFFKANDLAKSMAMVDCFPANSPQHRAYKKVSNLIFSVDYGRGEGRLVSWLRGKNAGLVQYFSARLKNDAQFFVQAKAFYSEIQAIDQDMMLKGILGKIPSLADESGKGVYKDFQPGWLWNLAMKHSQNNPRVAIELISLCGHDDVPQYESLESRHGEKISCPIYLGTMFYVPKALGKDADISDNLKSKITSVQAPTKGMGILPSKSYHIFGSALFSCVMKAEDLSNAEIEASNSLIARAYRVVDLRNRSIVGRLYSEKSEFELRADCKASRGICPSFWVGNAYDQAREDRFIAAKLSEYDSYALIERWKMIKQAPIVNLPIDIDLTIDEAKLKDTPDGWSRQRFEIAVNRLRTYAVDIEWTAEQHAAGSRFAQAHCGK